LSTCKVAIGTKYIFVDLKCFICIYFNLTSDYRADLYFMNTPKIKSCDIFCTVVDNYGDIGVCWRLAKQLANEYSMSVRLWVDDLASFSKLSREIVPALDLQYCQGVEIRHWGTPFALVKPAQLVIEAFACALPEHYVQAMAAQDSMPVWLNLEYLSAENWVAGCHGLPSPHRSLPLIKYFFFPGFSATPGGLLLEQGLLSQRDAFLNDKAAQANFWQSLGVPERQSGEVRVSLFCYENEAVHGLLSALVAGEQLVTCLIPVGRIVPQVADFLGLQQLLVGDSVHLGNLHVHILPFVAQEEYDKLLWACDINFVRGEDSCVRAQWAGKPFVWHIYPQQDGVHMEKLQALLNLYCNGLNSEISHALQALWTAWNDTETANQASVRDWSAMWNDFLLHRSMLQRHAHSWAKQLSGNNLALNLLDFSYRVGRIAPFKNQL
jgi:uncharacterized repeat protein (TIGR03837 family)